jgi:hypothetical protein
MRGPRKTDRREMYIFIFLLPVISFSARYSGTSITVTWQELRLGQDITGIFTGGVVCNRLFYFNFMQHLPHEAIARHMYIR